MSPTKDITCAKIVLVVEDEVELREITLTDIGRLGFRTCEAASVKAAKAIIEVTAVDVIVTDLKLSGGESGHDLIQWIAQRPGPKPKIVVISGHIDRALRQTLKASGVAITLEKPYLETELREALTPTSAPPRAI